MFINIVAKIMLVLFFVLLFLPLIGSSRFPKAHYKIQKVILEKMIPKSPDDTVVLVVGGFWISISLWCVLCVIFSFVKN